jgi:iron complex outermembrane receptor protein
VLAGTRPASAQTPFGRAADTPTELKTASLEALMQLEVTSVSKKEERLVEAPSAISVITHDDLERSGVTSIAEALRMVPGLEVARIDANKWAVSSRGFNGRFADKMLVLIDGRSVYTPLFSGVYWDVQDTVIEDIDRIEVIRGPGATLWGANAVNGVINIITKPASQTRGAFVSMTSATDERGALEARYGRKAGPSTDVRVFMKYVNWQAYDDPSGSPGFDNSDQLRAGARVDWAPAPDDAVMLEAEGYRGTFGTTYGPGSLLPFYTVREESRGDLSGGHLLARWSRAFSSQSDMLVQAYFDRTNRSESALAGETRDTGNIEFQHHITVHRRHDLVWGAGFRSTADDISYGELVRFVPGQRRDDLVNAFAQDELTVIPKHVRITGGLKLEHNAYTGWEWQPDGRVMLILPRRQTLWASVSRAVRTPSRAESDVQIDTAPTFRPGVPLPIVSSLRGSSAFLSETMRAHEVGYRTQPYARVSFDVAGFYNIYDHLRTFEPAVPSVTMTSGGPVLLVPVSFDNLMEGDTRGVEVTARVTPTLGSRIDATYTYLHLQFRHKPGSVDTLGALIEDDSPHHQFRVHAGATWRRLDLDGSVAYVGMLDNSRIPRYTRVDLRATWRLTREVSIAAGGRNLIDDRHIEFASTLGEVPTLIPRSGYVNLIWRR